MFNDLVHYLQTTQSPGSCPLYFIPVYFPPSPPVILSSPPPSCHLAFSQRPALWLQQLSLRKATHSACPNFALDLTLRKFDPARDVDPALGMDLSRVQCVVNGAEPIQADSIQRWGQRVRPP